jgi:endogenous inhibitor of DNA gyrase (YacG/DUF329 family)
MLKKKKSIKLLCPTCKKETSWKDNPFRPFCSERCRTIDLGSWADGRYKLKGVEPPDFEYSES